MADSVLCNLDGAVATVTLNRPAARNALTAEMKTELLTALRGCGSDPAIRAVLLTGAGQAFCAGQDLREHAGLLASGAAPTETVRTHYNPIITAITSMPKPVIAAIHGVAAGAGASLAFACDFRIATKDTLVALPEITIGQMPGSGGSQRVLRMVGMTRAKDMVLMGRRLPATEAHQWGLLTEVVEDAAALDKTVAEYAAKLNALSPLALSTLKRVLNQGEDASLEASFDLEGHAYEKLRDSHDYTEGANAFFEKRKPKYTGN